MMNDYMKKLCLNEDGTVKVCLCDRKTYGTIPKRYDWYKEGQVDVSFCVSCDGVKEEL